jgi:hypothetical protein
VNDLGKFAVIGAIMGALLLVGLLMQPAAVETTAVTTPAVTTPAPVVTVLEPKSIELLDPVYSEKGVFQDSTIRVAFDVSQNETGVETRLPFWLHNTSHGVINVLWDRCSIQLPEGNTVSVMSEEGLKFGTGSVISVAPACDLFDAMVPMSAVTWSETGYDFSYGILDQGIFTVVLAIERDRMAAPEPACAKQTVVAPADGCGAPMVVQVETGPTCPMQAPMGAMASMACGDGREVVYYTFRFIIR